MIYHTAAALLASGLVASVGASNIHAHHQNLHKKDWAAPPPSTANSTCGCTTYTTTWYGTPGLVQDKPTPTSSTTSSTSTSTSTTSSTSTSSSSSSSSSSSTSSTTWEAPTTSSESTSTSTWVAPTTSSETTPTSTWEAPTTSSEPTPSSTWEAPTTSSESTPTSTWEAPSTTWTPEAPSSTWEAPSSSDAPSSTANLWNAAIASVSIPDVSSATPSSGSSSSGGSSSSISPNGNKWAMTYTPYNNDGSCKSADDVSSDIASIAHKGFSTVRIYATDCSGPQNVGSACKANGLKLILGIYIDGSGVSDNAYAQVSTLTSWGQGQWDMVEMVVAGNEAIFNGYTTASALAGFIGDVKSKFKAAGYSGPVTTTEPLGTIQQYSSTICPAVDVIAANIHPYFNGAISALNAGSFVSSQLSDLSDACGGSKEAYNLETGWPWKGNSNGDAVASSIEQSIAIAAIVASAGSKSAIFSFENDGWKAPGDLGVEQYWGCANLFS